MPHTPAPAPQEPAVRYPFTGPANLVRSPGANGSETIAAYERSRRGLKPIVSKPPAPPYVIAREQANSGSGTIEKRDTCCLPITAAIRSSSTARRRAIAH